MEIERKWFVSGWPEGQAPICTYPMDQGYISVRPTVRIRKESDNCGKTEHIPCFKGKGHLSREEIETEIDETLFSRLKAILGCPLIKKERRDYVLSDGRTLEVNFVDEVTTTAFYYAEVEFDTEEYALSWTSSSVGLERYWLDEVTSKKGISMGSYWEQTRHANF